MTAAKVIEEIDDLPPDEQAKVIQHAFKLARTGRSPAKNSASSPNGWSNRMIPQKSCG